MKFESNYFLTRYKKITGDFSKNFLVKNINWYWSWYKIIDHRVGIKKGAKSLEVGCGIAAFSHILFSEKCHEILATDVSEYSIKKIKDVVPFRAQVLDLLNSDLTEVFDYIFAFEVFEHIQDTLPVFRRLKNNLAPNGYLIISTPYPYKKNWSDSTHVNMQMPYAWVNQARTAGYDLYTHFPLSSLPLLYKLNKHFSISISVRNNIKYLNSTEIFVFRAKED